MYIHVHVHVGGDAGVWMSRAHWQAAKPSLCGMLV